MEIIRDLINAKKFTKLSTIIIGNFDGVHLGHQEIIKKCSEIASSNKFGILTLIHTHENILKEIKFLLNLLQRNKNIK